MTYSHYDPSQLYSYYDDSEDDNFYYHGDFVRLPDELSNYEINRYGDVRNILTGELCKRLQGPNTPYESVTIRPIGRNRSVSMSIHRLLAIAFIKNNTGLPISELDVNHINGIKNTDIHNLEWATRQMNCLHAYKTGLRNDNNPVIVTNINTNETTEHYSQAEAARFVGMDIPYMCVRLRKANGNPFKYKNFIIKHK